jgi:ADP-ribose pyrophosphatase YjhB (NUDIX family)
MKNFQITAKEDGKKYWISRAMATRSEVIVRDNEQLYLLINKRGPGTPDFQGCWNITCGYLEYDVTLEENATKELLEETSVYIQSSKWKLQHIESDPERGNRQNVTAVYRVVLTMDEFNQSKVLGYTLPIEGGEENEVSSVWLMPLTMENINSIEWAFNHKETAIKILQQYTGKEYYGC